MKLAGSTRMRSPSSWRPISSLMPFLRPLTPLRAATVRHVVRLSSTASALEQAQVPESSTSSIIPPSLAPQETYFVNRTQSKNLPVYLLAKRGGNLRQTLIRKVEGNTSSLKRQLEEDLGLDPKTVAVNQLTNHVVIKGWHKVAVLKFLEERRF